MTVLAIVDVEVVVTITEVQVVRVAGAIVERTRPTVAAGTSVVEIFTFAVARSREKDTVAIGASDFVTSHTALRGPSPDTVDE